MHVEWTSSRGMLSHSCPSAFILKKKRLKANPTSGVRFLWLFLTCRTAEVFAELFPITLLIHVRMIGEGLLPLGRRLRCSELLCVGCCGCDRTFGCPWTPETHSSEITIPGRKDPPQPLNADPKALSLAHRTHPKRKRTLLPFEFLYDTSLKP